MSSDTRARAFEPFFTTKGVGKGTGLGLSQVYGFAQQLGGTAQIQSVVGEGTRVTVWLPRAQVVPESGEPLPRLADPVHSMPLRILLVDDDQAVRMLMVEMLSDLGHQAVAVEGGAAALAQLSTAATFDLLLVDFAMPGMNGAEVASEALRLRPRLPVLFVTGYADADVLKSWIQLGYRTLNKPFGTADLDRAIRQTIRARVNVVPLSRNQPI
jgi:CheY-like chemotaxis protein